MALQVECSFLAPLTGRVDIRAFVCLSPAMPGCLPSEACAAEAGGRTDGWSVRSGSAAHSNSHCGACWPGLPPGAHVSVRGLGSPSPPELLPQGAPLPSLSSTVCPGRSGVSAAGSHQTSLHRALAAHQIPCGVAKATWGTHIPTSLWGGGPGGPWGCLSVCSSVSPMPTSCRFMRLRLRGTRRS